MRGPAHHALVVEQKRRAARHLQRLTPFQRQQGIAFQPDLHAEYRRARGGNRQGPSWAAIQHHQADAIINPQHFFDDIFPVVCGGHGRQRAAPPFMRLDGTRAGVGQ
ncbi:hypothetical protein D3C87_1380880 [compost metagenome]